MKILFIISNLKAGGAERVCALLANKLSQNNEVSIASIEDFESFYPINESVKIISLGIYSKFSPFRAKFEKFHQIRKCIKENNPDVVISFMDITNICVLLSSIGLKNKIIITEHSHYSYLSSKFWRFLRRITYPFCDALSVLTKEDKNYFDFVKNVKVIHNPMFDIKDKKQDFKKENIILFVGRLEKIKGCDIFLDAMAKSKEFLKDYKILILGDGSQKENLLKQSKDLELENVQFLGRVSNVEEFYKKAKFIISTSRIEGLSNALIEAMFFDCIRISTPCSGPKELIENGIDGILCEKDEIPKKLKELINDKKMQEDILKKANLKKDSFRLENISKIWQNLINDI